MRLSGPVCLLSSLLLAVVGCHQAAVETAPIEKIAGSVVGQVLGGQQPVTAATIQLYSVGTTSDGGAATPLFTSTITTSDGTGVANANANAHNNFNALPKGGFSFSGADYTCASGSTLLYLVASGGNPGNSNGAANPQIELMSAIGTCTSLKSGVQSLAINEVTTVAAVGGLFPYMTAYNAVGSTPAHAAALAAAFGVTAEYANFQTGAAPGPALPQGYSADTPDVFALGNSVATCVNSTGGAYNDGSACGKLFFDVKPASGTAPTETVGALLDIRNNPTSNVAAIFNLPTAQGPFQPVNSAPPADFTLPITTQLSSAPVLSVPGGSYTAQQMVTISDADTNAAIYYTVDGTTPGPFSNLYSAAVQVGTSETLQAIAIDGSARSAVTSASYALTLTPAVSLGAVTVPSYSTNAVALTAMSNANGSVVTFGLANGATGSLSPATCTIAAGACTVSYTPTGTLAAGTYAGGLTASFTAVGSYVATTAASTLTVSAAPAESVLVSLTGTSGAAAAESPLYGSLIQARDGNFYGMSFNGGSSGLGAIYRITPAGVFTLMHSMTAAAGDAGNPYGGLIQGSDGLLYGMSYGGGSANKGTIFKISTASPYTFTLLHSFTNSTTDGFTPAGTLAQGADGLFYGTSPSGGANSSAGAFFSTNSTGTFTLLHSFSSATDGNTPYAGVVQGTDGFFYGTTFAGGANSLGTIYKISTAGALTVLHNFSTATTDVKSVYNRLVVGSDGSLYGVGLQGGANTYGGVFKLTTGGVFSLLHSFSNSVTDGKNPVGALLLGSDGNLWGDTVSGGSATYGSIFSISQSGVFTLQHSLLGSNGSPVDGQGPDGGMLQGLDGSFYGQTNEGGKSNDGAVFKLTPTTALPAPVVLTVPAGVTHGTSFTLGYAVSNAYSLTLQTCTASNTSTQTDWTGAVTGSPTMTNVTLTAPATAGTYTYALTCGGSETGLVTLTVQ